MQYKIHKKSTKIWGVVGVLFFLGEGGWYCLPFIIMIFFKCFFLIIYIYIYKRISSFGQIAQWLERVHGKHEVMGSNPIRANFLYGIEKP